MWFAFALAKVGFSFCLPGFDQRIHITLAFPRFWKGQKEGMSSKSLMIAPR
jgi:hypothetical protein